MRGKKTDSNFVGSFITECVTHGKTTQDEIVSEAKSRINAIDDKIKEVENLKTIRSKLVDVIITFEKPAKSSNLSEINSLPFFKIQNQHICKFICDSLREKNVDINFFLKSNFDSQDVLFTIKQLIEHKVISRVGNYLLKGADFNQYLKFVLLED